MPKYQINGIIRFKDGLLRPTVISLKADDKEEAKHFFSHGVHVNEVNGIPCDATTTLDFRTLKLAKRRFVLVDIDEFEELLGRWICEDDEDQWLVCQLYEEIKDGNGDVFQQLSLEGVDKIRNTAIAVLERMMEQQAIPRIKASKIQTNVESISKENWSKGNA